MKVQNFALTALFMLVAASSQAGVATISTPSVTKGQTELETGHAIEQGGNSEHAIQAMYGFTDWAKLGMEFTAERQRWNGSAGDRDLRYALTDLKVTFAFTKQSAQMPLSVGMRAQYGLSAVGGADEIDARLLLRRQDGPLDLVANLGLEHELGENTESGLGGDLRGSARLWLLDNGHLAPAIDYLGKTGPIKDLDGFDRQDHRVGPALYGDFDNNIAFDAGLLFGVSDNAPNQTLKLNVRYSF